MIVYTIIKETYKDENSTPIKQIIKSYQNKEMAYSELFEYENKEAEVRKQYNICKNCTADFEKEDNPKCYDSDMIDPACRNEVFEYHIVKYTMKEMNVIEEPSVTLNWRRI